MGTIFVDSVPAIPRAQRPRRRWPLLGLLAAIALLAAFAWPGEPEVALDDTPVTLTSAPDPTPPPAVPGTDLDNPLDIPGCESERPQLTIPVLDVSPSVINPDGADPTGRSFDESRLLVRSLLAAACDTEDMFGAFAFADSPVEIVPPTLLTATARIERLLGTPSEALVGGGTDIVAALVSVEQTLQRYPDHETTVVLLSDMVGGRPPQALHSKLTSIQADHLHLVALGDYLREFDSLFDSVVKIDAVRPGAVAQALTGAVAASRANPAPQPSR